MRTRRLAVALAVTFAILFGIVASTPAVQANCGNWPINCKQEPPAEQPDPAEVEGSLQAIVAWIASIF